MEILETLKKDLKPQLIVAALRAFVALCTLAIFLKIMGSVETIQSLDEKILLYVGQNFRSEEWNFFFIDLSGLGSMAVVTSIAIVSILYLILISDWAAAFHVGITVYGAFKIAAIAKHWIDRPRPTVILPLIHAGGMAFPSGHSVSAASIYFTLAFLLSRNFADRLARFWIYVIASLIVLAVSYSRVFVGVHYPSDVLAGALLGIFWALIMGVLFTRFHFTRDKSAQFFK